MKQNLVSHPLFGFPAPNKTKTVIYDESHNKKALLCTYIKVTSMYMKGFMYPNSSSEVRVWIGLDMLQNF